MRRGGIDGHALTGPYRLERPEGPGCLEERPAAANPMPAIVGIPLRETAELGRRRLGLSHTTDVRRRKLEIYKGAGFPEIWVLVPWEASVRARGLTIHVRRGSGYREAPESAAIPGWKAEEIYWALTEEPLSEKAWRALGRVALAMGAREGTKPEDDPLSRSLSLRGEARGDAKGYARGRAAMVHAALRSRGSEANPRFTADQALFGELSTEALMAAALACTDEADFRRRLRAAARLLRAGEGWS